MKPISIRVNSELSVFRTVGVSVLLALQTVSVLFFSFYKYTLKFVTHVQKKLYLLVVLYLFV